MGKAKWLRAFEKEGRQLSLAEKVGCVAFLGRYAKIIFRASRLQTATAGPQNSRKTDVGRCGCA